MAELVKGANTQLAGPVVRAVLRSGLAPTEIDICAMLLSGSRRVRSDHDFVFFNKEQSGCGSTRRLSPIELRIDLSQVPAEIEIVIVAASMDDDMPGSLAAHGGGFVVHHGSATISHVFDGLTTERCVIAAEIYRRAGGWKLRAVSQGYDDLACLVRHHGVQADGDVETTGPAPPDGGRPLVVDQPEAATLSPLPVETREIIDRVRSGVAARRASTRPHGRRPPVHTPHRGSVPAMQYRSLRHREADQLTAELEHHVQQLRSLLRQLPYPDLSPPAIDALLDASVPRPPARQWLRFGRREPPPPPPSDLLKPALRRLRGLATDPRHETAIEAWLWLSLHACDLQASFGRAERVTVRSSEHRVVVDVAAPDRSLVPKHGLVRYRVGGDRMDYQPLPDRERAALVEVLFSSAALAQTHLVATALGVVGLPVDWMVVTNVWEWTRDPATGQQRQICRCSLLTTQQELTGIHLPDVDPSVCVRSLGGGTSDADQVTPRAAGNRSVQHGRRIDLTTIDPYEFERLIAELAEAMGYSAFLTPRSGDHGVDVFVESTDTLANGRIVISAKRFNSTVGPDHVRALDTVVREHGAIKGILITTSRFGPESRRIAQNKPLELVDGERLRQWLATYLDIRT